MLRPVVDDDLPAFFEHEHDETARHMAAFVPKDPNDRTAFDAQWERMRTSEDIVVRTIVVDAEVVGHIASFSRGEDREVTYWIGRAFWGRGDATAALDAFLGEETTRPLFARVVKDNVASRRVLEKCGFRLSGEDRGFAEGRGQEVEEFIFRLD